MRVTVSVETTYEVGPDSYDEDFEITFTAPGVAKAELQEFLDDDKRLFDYLRDGPTTVTVRVQDEMDGAIRQGTLA